MLPHHWRLTLLARGARRGLTRNDDWWSFTSLPLVALFIAALVLAACAPLPAREVQAQEANVWPPVENGGPSPGCAAATEPVGLLSVSVRGSERSFLSRVPNDYRPGEPHDLVVAFHGRTNPNTQVRRYFELDAALPNAIIVYPSALAVPGGFRWSDPGDSPTELRDYALLDALIVAFGKTYCIDLERVFVVGHSLGASFANSVACHRGGVVRAVASVAGGIEGTACDDGVAAMIIHHPDDRLVPISEGHRVLDAFLLANDHQGPALAASEPELAALGCMRYGTDSPNPVLWCVHGDSTTFGGRYYPHNWPDATPQAIARFFRDLP